MKSLQEYIKESMSQEEFLQNVKSMFGINKNNNDFTHAYNLLKSSNTTKGLIDGVENYIKGKDEIKNTGYYLAMLFELSGLPVENSARNQQIIKSIIRNNKKRDLNAMRRALIPETGEKKLTIQIPNEGKLTELEFCEKYKDLANYIYDIEYFEKSNNSSANGKGELLLSLLIGGKNNNGSGDVTSDNSIKYEIKSSDESKNSGASLGNTFKSLEETTKNFIIFLTNKIIEKEKQNLNEEEHKQKQEEVKKILNIENNEFLLFKEKTHIGLNNLIANNVSLDDVLTCLIQTIFERYGYTTKDVNDIITNIKNKKYIDENEKNIPFNRNNTKDICGILHLIAYSRTQKFGYLIVIDKKTKYFKIINCEDINSIFTDCSKNIGFYSKNDKATNKDGSAKSGRKNSTYAIYYKK